MRPLRVCQLITTLGIGGAERGLYELVTRMDRQRFEVEVFALRDGPMSAKLAAAGIAVTVLGVRGKWDIMKLPRLTKLIRDGRFDLLHTHLFHADLAGRPAAKAAGVPHLVHTVWTAEGRFRPWQFAYARLLKQSCNRVICVSQSVRDHHAGKSKLPDDAYIVIPWGVDVEKFRRDEASRQRLRSAWQLADDDVLLAFVGRLEFYKGVKTLLAALGQLASAGRGVRAVIAGDGPQRRVVEEFIAHGPGGGLVRMLGMVSDVPAVLSAADVYVMPSLWEGWPLALGEAMSASLPAIGSDSPGIRDLIVPEQTGLLVERQNAGALASAIGLLVADGPMRARLGAAGRRRIVDQFTIEQTVAAHERLYDEVAGHRRQE
jgi:glycosyltransferase involved in cell wall biosynthesis